MGSTFKSILFIGVGLIIGAVVGAWFTMNSKNKEIELLKSLKQEEIASKQNELEQCQNLYVSKQQEFASRLAYESMSDLPIRVGVRKAFLNDTRVLQLTNFSRDSLRVQINWSVEGTTQQKIVELYPNDLKELGHQEGYPFKAGDVVNISSGDYKTKNIKIP